MTVTLPCTKPDRNLKNDKLTKTVDPNPVFIFYMNSIDFFLQISFTLLINSLKNFTVDLKTKVK